MPFFSKSGETIDSIMMLHVLSKSVLFFPVETKVELFMKYQQLRVGVCLKKNNDYYLITLIGRHQKKSRAFDFPSNI